MSATKERPAVEQLRKTQTLLNPASPVSEDPETGIISYWADVTPGEAELLLAVNTHNRRLALQEVYKLRGAMERGEWKPHTKGIDIGVGQDGPVLWDGQHRLEALAGAGADVESIRLFVSENVPADSQEVIDIGKKRQFRDMLHLGGEAHSVALGAGVRVTFGYMRHGIADVQSIGVQPTPQQLFRVLHNHPGLRDSAATVGQNKSLTRLLTPGIATGLHYLFKQVDEEEGERFFRYLAMGGMSGEHNIDLLYNTLFRHLTGAGRLSSRRKAAYAIKTFNAWRKGKTIQTLRYGTANNGSRYSKEKFPTIQDCSIPAGQKPTGSKSMK